MAHARIGIYKVKPDKLQAVLDKGRAELPDLMKRQPGFLRYLVLRAGPETIVSLSSWDTAQQAQAAADQLTGWVKQNGADAFVGAENHVGELSFMEQSTEESPKHARVAVYKFRAGSADTVVKRAREGFVPIVRAQPGFVRYAVVKTGDDAGVSYSGWASRDQADAAVAKAADWVKQNLGEHVVSVQNYVGEVLWSARR